MWSEDCFLFAAQKPSRLHRNATEHLILGVDQPPFAVDFVGFGGKRLHRRLKKGTETTGRGGHCQPAESGAALVCLARPPIISPNKSRVSLGIMAMIGAVPATGSAGTEPATSASALVLVLASSYRRELKRNPQGRHRYQKFHFHRKEKPDIMSEVAA